MFSDILLKTFPPRATAGFLVRPHLSLERFRLAGIQLIEISAPDGFGKTSQLAQWHREATVAGMAAMWLSLDAQDEVPRLIHGLSAAAGRSGMAPGARADFGDLMAGASDHREFLTRWLTEVAQSQQESLLFLDDVDHLPVQSLQDVVHYLLANSANNLRIVLSSRPHVSALSGRTMGSTPMIRLTARELRFQEQETTAIVSQALVDLPHAQSMELAVRIHALTEGWPLGVRLAVASRLHNGSSVDWESSVSANMSDYFRDSLLDPLPPDTRAMLVRIALFDPIHPDLCRAVLDEDAPVSELERLAEESPLLAQAREGGWLRLHPMAREILVERHLALPVPERRAFAAGAARWYEANGQFEAAARQAILADDRPTAMRLAEASLRNMLVQGRLAELLDWYGRASVDELRDRAGFWAPAAWALAMSNRSNEARALVERIFGQEDLSEEARFEGHLILATVAGYCDDLAQLSEFVAQWPSPPAFAGKGEIAIHATSQANYDLICGQTVALRSRWQEAGLDYVAGSPVARGFGDLFVGLSYLWEGKPQLAYESLHEALARAEGQMDRSNRVVSMIAAALAQACLETDRLNEARLHLALRMPVLEKQGLPDIVISAFCTLADLAEDEGRQDHAEVQLESLAETGRARGIVRVEVAALLGLVRFHARHGRATVANALVKRLERIGAALPSSTRPEIRQWVALHSRLAFAHAHAVSQQVDRLLEAVAAAEEAQTIARRLNRGADTVRAWFLRAEILTLLGDPISSEEMGEAVSLCRAVGLLRPLKALGLVAPAAREEKAGEAGEAMAAVSPAEPDGSFLTPREHSILLRLVGRMSNKEIALAMGLGEETVKWHLKNLFRKLDAGDRRSAVTRARTLGLV